MRVLYFSNYYPPEIGAAATRAFHLTRALTGAGAEVELVVPLPSYPLGRVYPGTWPRHSVEEGGLLQVHRFPAFPAPQHRLGRRLLSYVVGCVAALVASLAAVRGRTPDLVVASSPPPTTAVSGAVAAWLLRRPLLLDIRDLWSDALVAAGLASARGVACRALSWLERSLYRRAAYVSVTTAGAASRLSGDGRVAEGRLAVCPNGVGEEFYDPARRAKAETEAKSLRRALGIDGLTVAGYAGNLGFVYDLETLLGAAAALRDRPLAFLIAGQGALRPRLEEAIQRRGLTNVQVQPPALDRDRLLALYLAMDVVVAPLVKAELFEVAVPVKALELAALGRPLVLMGCPEAERVLSFYPLKFGLEAGDRVRLIQLLSVLCDHPPAALPAAEAAELARHLSWEAVAGTFAALAERAARGGQAGVKKG